MAMIATKLSLSPSSPHPSSADWWCTVTLEELSAVRTGLQRLAPGCTQNTRACSMFTKTQLPSLPPPSPVQHTQNPSTKENIVVMRHLNDNWRVPMKRPSLHSEWDKQKRAASQDSISSWSSGGGTKLITSS